MNIITDEALRSAMTDTIAVAETMSLPAADVLALAAETSAAAVAQAVAEASRAGSRVFYPPGFIKRRARLIAQAESHKASTRTRIRNQHDMERVKRLEASELDAAIVADETQTLSSIPLPTLELIRQKALDLMPDMVRGVAMQRGFARSSVWRAMVIDLYKKMLDAGNG
jgi:hypothetical protein